MNTPFKPNEFKASHFKPCKNILLANVLLALASMATSHASYAACDGTLTCTDVSDNIDTTLIGTVNLDSSAGAATLNNTTVDPTLNPPDYGAVIRNTATTVGTTSAINVVGNNPVVINNRGLIDLATVDASFNPTRVFDPAAWFYDEATHKLLNNGVEVGYAAAISAIGNTASLTVNNFVGSVPYLNPNTFQATSGQIYGAGDLTAGIYTNAQLLTVNGEFQTSTSSSTVSLTPSYISKIVSFAGGNFTPPALQDGTQYATNVTAGTTVFNANVGDLYVVDRNPLLTEAEALSGLTLAYGQDDVGPRNSIITGVFANAYLGSGAHVINHRGGSNFLGSITVDQNDVAVTDVVGGISTPLYFVHGDRTFTLSTDILSNPLTINDVAGAVNTVNINNLAGSINATNGTGTNTLNLSCIEVYSQDCANAGSLSGFTTMNVTGAPTQLNGTFSVSGDINLFSGESGFVILTDGTLLSKNSILNGALIANNIIIGAGANWTGYKFPYDVAGADDRIGSITGHLINKGKLDVGRATLTVDGDANMEAGSSLLVTVGNFQQGKLSVTDTHTVTFDPASILLPSVHFDAKVGQGYSFVAASHVSGIPLVQTLGFLQWFPSLVGDDLVLTSNIGIPSFLTGQVTTAASNALNAVFTYTGSATIPVELQTELLRVKGDNLISTAERLRPEINDGAYRMVQGNTDKVFGILETRMLGSYLKATPEDAQVATNGDMAQLGNSSSLASGKGVWVQGFGDRGLQESIKGVDGYNSSAAGFAFGVDKPLDAAGNQRLGFAFGYTRGNVTDTGYTANNRTDINSYLGAAYGSWAMEDWYINGMLGIGRNTYETYRHLLQYTAAGQHDSWQFSGRVDAGMPILFNDNLTFVPMASLDYSHIKESGYTENGKDSRIALVPDPNDSTKQIQLIENGLPVFTQTDSPINLKVDGRSFDSIRSGLGGKAIYSLQEKGWGADLELHGLYRHEFGNVAQDSNARFTFGGASFTSKGLEPVRDSLLLGGSVRLTSDDENDQLTLLTSYDAELRDKYLGQTMTLNVRYDFDQAPSYRKGAKAKLAAMAAKKVTEQKVGATEKDIVALNQAMQTEAEYSPEVLDANQQAIDKTIKTWTTALSNKNLDVYFNSYAADFATPDGSTRQQWERNRKTEISKEANPAINISYLSIKPDGNRALAMFTQTVTADAKPAAVRKIVDLENRNGRWLIVREDSMAVEQ